MVTPNLDEIRSALAAEIGDPDWFRRRKVLRQNAPTWLAALCDEIEAWRKMASGLTPVDYYPALEHARAEIERLRAEHSAMKLDCDMAEAGLIRASTVQDLVAERDAALADLDRAIKMFNKAETQAWADLRASKDHYRDDALAWRACADQLAAAVRVGRWHDEALEALAEYERLKGGMA